MTTVLAVYNSEGCQGRCDGKCHDASGGECNCICGGKNHGAGQQQAINNTREMVEDWLKDYAKKVEFTEVEVPAMYTCQTRTAIKIARTINAQKGFNAVLDVRRAKRGKRSVWEVDVRPYEGIMLTGDIQTLEYSNLRHVEIGVAQAQMFPTPSEIAVNALSALQPITITSDVLDGNSVVPELINDWLKRK